MRHLDPILVVAMLVGCGDPVATFRDVECRISWRDEVFVGAPTSQGLARVTYGAESPAVVVLEIYDGWNGSDARRVPLEVGDIVGFQVVPMRDRIALEGGVSVPGIKGGEPSEVPNPRLRIAIDGTEIATVGARPGALLSQFVAFRDHERRLSAFTHTTVTNADGSHEHWGAPFLALSQRLTIEVLAPGWVDAPAQVDPP